MKLRITTDDPGDPKAKKSTKVAVKKPFDWGAELKAGYNKPLKYDNNRSVKDVVLAAAKRGNIDPSELLTSSWVEGLNEAAVRPDNVSEAYNNALAKDKSMSNYPVDGFLNYGVDTFGNNYEALKKYLPKDFDFKTYDALNESNKPVKTVAFKNNEDAMVAKAAFMNMEKDRASSYAKKKYGVDLDDKAKKYFTMAAYNGGPGAAQHMIDEYVKASDKNKYIDEGQTQYLGGKVHRNIAPRMKMLELAKGLLNPTPSPAPIPTASPLPMSPQSSIIGQQL